MQVGGNMGIVRRVDDLGRIVLPKEMRKILKVNTGDALEITSQKNEITIKRYSPVCLADKNADAICNAISKITNKSVVLCDTEKVVLATLNASFLKGVSLSKDAYNVIKNKQSFSISKKDGIELIKLTEQNETDFNAEIIMPILDNKQNAIGLIAMFCVNKDEVFDGGDIKIVKLVAQILSEFYGDI